VYIKISGHYRLLPPSPTEQYLPLKEIFFSFLKSGGEQKLVWASDWPHTRFGSIDTIGWANMVVGWCEEYVKQEAKGDKREKDIEKEVERLVSLIFKENADTLWLGRQK
jgi:predicted TIM-barrel fold metal-dependent hydrolase